MTIRGIKIENFERIERFESSFHSRLVFLPEEESADIVNAISAVLRRRTILAEIDKSKLESDTLIEAEIEAAGSVYFVTARWQAEKENFSYEVTEKGGTSKFDFYNLIYQNMEEEQLSYFCPKKNISFADRLKHYKDYREFYLDGAFSTLTDSIGVTKTFRAYLNKYIKNYTPERFLKDKNYRIALRRDGQFVAEDSEQPGKQVELNESEKVIFNFYCYLNVNRFWKEVEAIRDMNYVPWPLFVSNASRIHGYPIYLLVFWNKASHLNRQVIICDNRPNLLMYNLWERDNKRRGK